MSYSANISTLIFGAILLALSTYTDLTKHRIPNVISLGGLVGALTLQAALSGWDGFINGLAGFAVGFGLFLPFYILRGMGAGDVKLMGAIGACLGPTLTLVAVGCSFVVGGVMAFAVVISKRGGRMLLQRYLQMLKTFFYTHRLIYLAPTAGDAGAARFPFAAAISAGTVLAVVWNTNVASLLS